MRINEIEISGYRSVRELRMELGDITLVTGPNGSGKSNIYQAIKLIQEAANGRFARSIVEEGGMESLVWAGKRSKGETSPRVGLFVGFDELSYELEFGFVPASERPAGWLDLFNSDPDIKSERVQVDTGRKIVTLLEREGPQMKAKNMDGRNVDYPAALMPTESVLSEIREPHNFPEASALRQEFGRWRFYHDFRTDFGSPIRKPQIRTITHVLSHDGSDLASAIETIRGVGDDQALSDAIERAFPGSSVRSYREEDRMTLRMRSPGLYRELELVELSDGTLQYLCLVAALLSPRPPSFMVFNEPETSIHPSLMEPLAELFLKAAKETQLFITTHSEILAGCLRGDKRCASIELEKVGGETRIIGERLGQKRLDDDEDD